MKFRNRPEYHGEFFVAFTIPATEDKDVVPCDSTVNADGSYRFQLGVLYSHEDVDFAVQRGRGVIAQHRTWAAGLYRAGTGALMGEIHV